MDGARHGSVGRGISGYHRIQRSYTNIGFVTSEVEQLFPDRAVEFRAQWIDVLRTVVSKERESIQAYDDRFLDPMPLPEEIWTTTEI
jgi:hypothetical protein